MNGTLSKRELEAEVIKANRLARVLQNRLDNYDAHIETVTVKGLQYAPEWLSDVLVIERADGQELFIPAFTSIKDAFTKA